MLVCIDKITCARMFQRIEPRWQAKAAEVRAASEAKQAEAAAAADEDRAQRSPSRQPKLRGQAQWMDETIIEIIISEAQNEVARLQEMGLRHHPAPRA